MNYSDDRVFGSMKSLLDEMKSFKPNDRGEKDRAYAVTITELEKLIAYFAMFVMKAVEDNDGGND